jgi:hypothetical protein
VQERGVHGRAAKQSLPTNRERQYRGRVTFDETLEAMHEVLGEQWDI